jgi:hypothetical protein
MPRGYTLFHRDFTRRALASHKISGPVAPTPDWQFDTGVYYGITGPAEDWRVFAGASARFPLSR